MKKLTLVSIKMNGKRVHRFVYCTQNTDGKTIVSKSVIESMQKEICGLINTRGMTFTVGG